MLFLREQRGIGYKLKRWEKSTLNLVSFSGIFINMELSFKMNFLLFMYAAVNIYTLVGVNGSKVSKPSNVEICENINCSDVDITTIASESEELSDDLKKFFYENKEDRNNSNEIFNAFDSDNIFNDSTLQHRIKNEANDEKFNEFSITSNQTTNLKNDSDSIDYETNIEVNNNSVSKESSISSFDVTEKSTKLTTVTTQLPPTANPPSSLEFLHFQNSRTKQDVCLCDLTAHQCDLNCCCDKDCSPSHWTVFTKCNDVDPEHDSRYCYRNNFVFKNNTKHKIIQNEGGLFCILRDNSQYTSHFKTAQIISSLESFHKNLPDNYYRFSHKSQKQSEFEGKDYKVGSNVWVIQNGEIKPFEIPGPSIGHLCTSRVYIKYLVDQETVCSHPYPQNEVECGRSKTENIFYYLRDLKIIASPGSVNKSHIDDVTKICQNGTCIGINSYICKSSMKFPYCIKLTEKGSSFPKVGCRNTIPKINYQIWHNGSNGITKFEAYIWLKDSLKGLQDSMLQTTGVKYSWVGSPKKVFERSGNPGYLTGKPILAGRKIYYAVNGTEAKKEAIEMSLDPNDWLSVIGSERGLCSFKKRIPVKFRENGQYTCSLQLNKDNFGKDKCLDLQNTIFKYLIGSEITNATNDNYFNKFIATFGNSEVEKTGDWVQVLIDLSPVISSQIAFKSNYNNLMCRNIITDLFIEVAYSNIGSFSNPQPKILGVSFHFGKHRDLIFYCDTSGCENTGLIQYSKLSSMVHFIDITEPAVNAFAEPLGLEVKLPHDFFYPFFSRSSISKSLNTCALVLILVTLL